jgi:hypothetical protein
VRRARRVLAQRLGGFPVVAFDDEFYVELGARIIAVLCSKLTSPNLAENQGFRHNAAWPNLT